MWIPRIRKILTYGCLLLVFSVVEQSIVLCQLKDLFPLGKGTVVYRYFGTRSVSFYSPATRESSYQLAVQAGKVTYTVLDSVVVNDSTVYWNIKQSDSLVVRNAYSSSRTNYDVTQTVAHDSNFVLIEKTRGFHEISASMPVWSFKGVKRFSLDSVAQVNVSNDDLNFTFAGNFPIALTFKNDSGLVKVQGGTHYGGFSRFDAEILIEILSFDIKKAVPLPPPTNMQLYQNYPNPFNPTTTIEVDIPEAQFVSLKVFDVLGKHVSTIDEGEKKAGTYKMVWTPRNLPSGVYFCRMQAAKQTRTTKMVLLK